MTLNKLETIKNKQQFKKFTEQNIKKRLFCSVEEISKIDNWVKNTGITKDNSIRNIKPTMKTTAPKKIKKNKNLFPSYLTHEEVKQLSKLVPTGEDHSKQYNRATQRLLFILLWRTGVRISESISLNNKSIILDSPPYLQLIGKGTKERVINIHDELFNILQSYNIYDRATMPLINLKRTQAYTYIMDIYQRGFNAGILSRNNPRHKKLSPHSLRHSYARHLLLNNVPINEVQRLLGHANTQMTFKYLQLIPSQSTELNKLP